MSQTKRTLNTRVSEYRNRARRNSTQNSVIQNIDQNLGTSLIVTM